jgi:carbonic anhydrase/acetyltransferase-like protein (isoleucine patch superfamily)
MNAYRKLTPDEISTLEKQHCRCADWNAIEVVPNFSPLHLHNVNFSGQVKLGMFTKTITLPGGLQRNTGISNANIHNCDIRNNVYINNIRSSIANYVVDEDSMIENVDILVTEGKCSFGNGVRVNVINEVGGREVPIYNELSAQVAYIIALYRHRPKVIKQLFKLIDEYAEAQSSTMGYVGKNVHITNSRTLRNMVFKDSCIINGVYKLGDGTINSCPEDPAYIGQGVIASHFIVAEGAKISDSTIIDRCFVGQSCQLSKMYSAEHSLFFANCAGFHGEACSIFAGPFTTTHHKSTLLIATLCSFFNAGSGSNQSNHMYKLGPIHQGVLERGGKTASDSYLLWPAKIGAFTVVMGRHGRNSDTSALPFSYLIENENKSVLVPGVNLRSVGTIRDAQKWPKRDVRKAAQKRDLINFNLLSPFTIHKMVKGHNLLLRLEQHSGQTSEFYSYHSTLIKRSSLKNGIRLYEMGITKFLGNSLISRLEKAVSLKTNEDIRRALQPDSQVGLGEWMDVAGMIAPQTELTRLLDDIEKGTLATLKDIVNRFEQIHKNYYDYEWTWAAKLLRYGYGKMPEEFTAEDVIKCVELWKKSVEELNELLYADAKKEFTLSAMTGFGVDGSEEEKQLDFEQVRGAFEENAFVVEIINHTARKTALGNSMIEKMKKIEIQEKQKK